MSKIAEGYKRIENGVARGYKRSRYTAASFGFIVKIKQ